jgi:hypothetical protein
MKGASPAALDVSFTGQINANGNGLDFAEAFFRIAEFVQMHADFVEHR